MTATEPVEIYRLKLRYGTNGSSSPDWKIYENFQEFEEKLLEAAIEAKSRSFNYTRGREWLKFDWWNRYILGREDDYSGRIRKVSNVIGAEKLVDGQWVELNYTLHPPRLEFT